jgi:hypothetical protein
MATARAPVEHHVYNTNIEFASFRPYRRAHYQGLDSGVEGVPGSALPSAIALMICTRITRIAAATLNVIRRRAANQFRKSGTVLASQPGFAQIR